MVPDRIGTFAVQVGCTVRAGESKIGCELAGKLADPQTALPVLERAVALRRALCGAVAAGPFR